MYRKHWVFSVWWLMNSCCTTVVNGSVSSSTTTTTGKTSASAADSVSSSSSSIYNSSSRREHVISQYKAHPHDTTTTSTPLSIRTQWEAQDKALWSYVEQHVPAVLDHTGSAAFDEHLKGVQAVLRYWDAPEYLQTAGLFHSIYGTEGFQGFSLPLSQRSVIQNLIGTRAERLCWIFCMVDRYTVDQTVWAWKKENNNNKNNEDHQQPQEQYTFRARPELGRFEIVLSSKEEWLDFIELTFMDWMEQVEGAAETPLKRFLWNSPGEAYAYRRSAYQQMSLLLAQERSTRLAKLPEMYQAIMATEPASTRHLEQPRTPPMSTAAEDAWDALRSAGVEEIPTDLSPQPREISCLAS